jgi:hypothetical protein
MIAIEADTFNVDAVMALFQGVDTNFVLAGTWNKIPWRVWLNEPSDTLQPASWTLELGDHRYPLAQSSSWEMTPTARPGRRTNPRGKLGQPMGDGCPHSETSARSSPTIEMPLTAESCHRLDLKRLFRSGRIGPGSTGSTVPSWRCRATDGDWSRPREKMCVEFSCCCWTAPVDDAPACS